MINFPKTLIVCLFALGLESIFSPTLAQSTQSEIEPKALELLKTMGDRLSTAQSLSFTAITTYESPSAIGPPLVYTTIAEVLVKRPNQLQVLTLGDGLPSEFYYDGKSIIAYSPTENLVATAEVPSNLNTIDKALNHAYETASIYFPFIDVIVDDPYKDMTEGLKSAFVMGQSKVIGGIKTDIVVVVNDQVFAQIWIGVEDKLPRMIRAIYRDDPSRLRHQVEFLNWELNPSIDSKVFQPDKIQTAKPIPFASPDLMLPSSK